MKTVSLPGTLRDGLLGFDEFTQGKSQLPESLEVARVDLNGDRVDEFIVQSPQTYIGGPQMYVFEAARNGRFSTIAEAHGTIYFAPRVNGYFEIVSQARAGGGAYTRALLRYEGIDYRLIRIADYREVEPGGSLQFVRERSSRPSALGAGRSAILTESQTSGREATVRQLLELRKTQRASLTVRQFLGQITDVTVTNVSNPRISFVEAQKFIGDLMDSLLEQPHSEGPSSSQIWSELVTATITGSVHYADGRVGRLETDGRAHLFAEDQIGSGWWYRWNPKFPRSGRKQF